MTYYPSLIKFPLKWNIKRNTLNDPSIYPKYTYGKTFEESYDYYTLFVDVFRNEDKVLFVSPPFLNFKEIFKTQVKLIDEKNNNYELEYQLHDRCELGFCDIPDNTKKIFLCYGEEKIKIEIKERNKKFDNKKVICTMIKNEPTHKILNWIEYHIKNYDIDGFIIFNNQSDLYSSEELYRELLKNYSEDIIEVVDWDTPFGVIGPPWDSDWSQYILLNLCKYNFCFKSSLILNHDIDEYFVSEYSLDEILDSMIEQKLGSVVYRSKNISCYTEGDISVLNSRYYYHPEEVNNEKMTKWMSIPSKSLQSIYTLHNVFGSNVEFTDDFYYAHMWVLSSENHDQKNHCSPKQYRKTIRDFGYVIDSKLKNNFKNCSIFTL